MPRSRLLRCCWRSSTPAAGWRRRRGGATGGGNGAPTSRTSGTGSTRHPTRHRRSRAAARARRRRAAPCVLAAAARQETRDDHAGHPLRLAAHGAQARHSPLVAVLTLGLGIGANVTMYSWVDRRMLLRPMPASPTRDRLVALNGTTRTRSDLSVSYPDFVDCRQRRPDSVDDLIAYTLAPMNLRTERRSAARLRPAGQRQLLRRARRPAGARPRVPSRGRRDAERDIRSSVFSHNFWQRRFARRSVHRRPHA